MVDLSFQDLQNVRMLSQPASLKGCARAYAIATTYFPVLIQMAEKYLKLSMDERIRKGYSAGLKPDGTWCIRCADGYEEPIGCGDEGRTACQRLVARLNGTL